MARFNCFTLQFGRKKKDKGDKRASETANNCKEGVKTLQVEFEHPVKSSSTKDSKMTSLSIVVPFNVKENSKCKVEVRNHESPIGNAPEFAYEGEDEHEENSPMKRDFSDSDLHARLGNSGIEEFQSDTGKKEDFENRSAKDAETNFDQFQCGHLSDPGTGKAEFWASPELKRSCSNLETGDVLKKIAHELRTSKSQPFEELQGIERRVRLEMSLAIPGSPNSVMTHHSADRVMLKKHSSSQVLPSRSRRLWWKLFLWSHRNLHKPETAKPPRLLYVNHAFNQQGGYSSDTLEPNGNLQQRKLDSPGSFTGEESRNDGYDLWPQNQWVAFSTESSSFRRVEEWVKDLEATSPLPVESSNNSDDGNVFLTSPETGGSLARSMTPSFRRPNNNLSREVLHANSIVQSLNSSSTTAHISGTGLKAIPTISCFSGLRSVNLSSNLIVHITPGSLPKGLHTLSLSRNKITTIEGLRELTRLRILDLSYNRISRIGHGLSNCTLLKELYLAGNKISDVEGLHRLLKLTVLDLSFNKITTTKALGQLVGNYSSLLALNLLGNPIQSNISEDQLRKAISSLLPKLAYLNKQPVKPQMAREVLMDNVAKAAVRNGGVLSSRRKAAKWGNQSAQKGGSLSTAHRSRSRSTSRSRHHQSPLKIRSSVLASSSH